MSIDGAKERGTASLGTQVLAGLLKDPSRKMDSPIFQLVTLGRNLTVGSVALILLWALLFRPPASTEQTRQIVQAIERGAAAQVESSEKVALKLEILTDRVAEQTTEVARVQALAAGRYRCPTCPQCPDCRCQPCPESAKPLPSQPVRRSTVKQ